MEGKPRELITVPQSRELARHGFLSGARIIVRADEAVLIRLSHEQHVQMKSQRCLVAPTGGSRHTRAHAAKSSTAHAHCLPPIGREYSRAHHRERQTAANLTAFMAGIRRLMNANAILWQKLYARFSEHAFDQAYRVLVSRVATLDILERISMKTGRPNRQIESSTRHPNLCACQRARNAKQSNQRGSK